MLGLLPLLLCFQGVASQVGKCGTNNIYSIGPCATGKAGPCGAGGTQPGYACDATLKQCCPYLNVSDPNCQIGPSVSGTCPPGYISVSGICVDLNCNSPPQQLPIGNCGTNNMYSIGPCVTGKAGPCGAGGTQPGYSCDTTLTQCCPYLNVSDPNCQIGPSICGTCPPGYISVSDICVDLNCNSPPQQLPIGNCGINKKLSIGPCTTGKAGPCGAGGAQPGYSCDSTLTQCCPYVNTVDQQFQLGPALSGTCPIGYAIVYGIYPGSPDPGVCVDLNSIGK